MSAIEPYQLAGSYLVGPNLKIEAAALVEPERQADPADGHLIILDAIVDIANGAYRAGRASVLQSYDDRAALRDAVLALRALATIVGLGVGEQHRSAADSIDRLLRTYEESRWKPDAGLVFARPEKETP